MTEKVIAAIKRYRMLKDCGRVLVALSGGADSTALLLILKELGYDVFAVHVNHNLRGEESDRDEEFCRELCRSKGIELYAERVDVKSYCKKNKCSIELGARELRYKALEKHADGCRIATAHTLSDVLETAIFNLTRGCGIKGLSSIPPARGNIIRPLINCTREEIEEYLACKGQNFVTDSTNLEPDCARNIIRLNVIPELKKINSGLMKSFAGTIEAIRETDTYIDDEAHKLLSGFDCKSYSFTDIPDDAVLSRVVSSILRGENIEPSFERIAAVKELIKNGGKINIRKGVYLCGSEGKLWFEYVKPAEQLCIVTPLRDNVDLGFRKIVLTKISHFDISSFNKDALRYIIDCDKMGERYVIRHYIGNEKIRLPKRGISSTIKKLLADISPEERRERIVIADKDGAVFVEGVGVCERICCDENTRAAVRIDITDIKETEK